MFVKLFASVFNDMSFLTTVILIATATPFVLSLFVKYFLPKYKTFKAAGTFPGPKALPILGNAFAVMGDTENLLKQLIGWTESYASPFRVWLGPKLHIILHDAENVKEVLQNHKVVEKSPVYSFARDFVSNGLMTAPVKVWRVHRKLVNSAFNTKALPSYSAFLAEKAQTLVDQIKVESDGKDFEIYPYLSACSLSMILGTTLGTSLKLETEELRRFSQAVHRFFSIGMARATQPWLHPTILFNCSSYGREYQKTIKNLNAMTQEMIRRAEIVRAKEKLPNGDSNISANRKSSNDSLPGLFMNLPQNTDDFTYKDFEDELKTMVIGGYHSLASTMDFMTRMLAYNPDIQDKVYEELYSIYGSEDTADRPVTLEDLPRLEYLERVIYETIRLFPPGGLIEREILEDLDIGSCVLPAGCTILIFIMSLHRNEEYWPNPLKFDPDRFLPENVAKRHSGAYIPFSSGPRNCIGTKYAMMAAKIMSATLLRRYILRTDTILPVEDIRLKIDVMVECVEPWRIRVQERNSRKVEAQHKIPTKNILAKEFISNGLNGTVKTNN